jgi:hypothetical protein
MYIRTHTPCIHTCTSMFMHIHTHACICIHAGTRLCTYGCSNGLCKSHECTYVRTYIHTRTLMHPHFIHAHTHTHIFIHTYTQGLGCALMAVLMGCAKAMNKQAIELTTVCMHEHVFVCMCICVCICVCMSVHEP